MLLLSASVLWSYCFFSVEMSGMRMFIAHPRGRGAPPAHQLKHDCPGSSMLAFFVFSSTYNVTANSTMFPVVVAVVVVLMLLLLAVGGGGGGCCGWLWCLLLMLLVVVGGGQLGLMMAPKWSLRRQAGQDHSIHPSPPPKKKELRGWPTWGQLGRTVAPSWPQAGPKLESWGVLVASCDAAGSVVPRMFFFFDRGCASAAKTCNFRVCLKLHFGHKNEVPVRERCIFWLFRQVMFEKGSDAHLDAHFEAAQRNVRSS